MAGAQLKVALPSWTPARVIAEACAAWAVRHPDNPCDPGKSDWCFIVNVVHSWARHGWTNYEQVVSSETRQELHTAIAAQTFKAYPWLRSDTRSSQKPKEEPRPMAALSQALSRLVAHRSDLLMELGRLRRVRPLDRTKIAKLEAGLKSAETSPKGSTST
jgi:hypothetical protein